MAPQRPEAGVLVEPPSAGIAQIRRHPADLVTVPVALDHDPAEGGALDALDRLDGDPLGLLDDAMRHPQPVPMPPAPARGVGDPRPDLTMEVASLVPVEMGGALRGKADPVEHPIEPAVCDCRQEAALKRNA